MPRNETEKSQWKGGIIIRHETDPTLSPQHQAFVEAYVKNGGNASAAEREAGLTHGSSLLKNHKIREAIEGTRVKVDQVHEQEAKEMAEAAAQMVKTLQQMLE
jgi:phage terminase small subunit